MSPISVRPVNSLAVNANWMPRVANDCGARGNIVDNDAVRTNFGSVANANRAEQLGSRTDSHIVANRWVPLAGLKASATQGDSLIQRYIRPDLSRFADHHAHTVVNE
jgi:hypothetical protein